MDKVATLYVKSTLFQSYLNTQIFKKQILKLAIYMSVESMYFKHNANDSIVLSIWLIYLDKLGYNRNHYLQMTAKNKNTNPPDSMW